MERQSFTPANVPTIGVGQTYSGNELCSLLNIEESRYFAFVSEEYYIIATDAGNDNYEIVAIIKRV